MTDILTQGIVLKFDPPLAEGEFLAVRAGDSFEVGGGDYPQGIKVMETHQRGRESVIDHPSHYGGADDPYEAIKVIEAWSLGFNLGNTVKYIARAGKKPNVPTLEDLKKAAWYLDREIQRTQGDG